MYAGQFSKNSWFVGFPSSPAPAPDPAAVVPLELSPESLPHAASSAGRLSPAAPRSPERARNERRE
jgi:hypothetical protein